MSRLFLSFFLLLVFSLRSSVASIGHEQPVSEPVYDFNPYALGTHFVAGSGDQFLVAWSYALPQLFRIARVSSAGDLLDPNGLEAVRGAETVAVTGTSEGYLLAWAEAGEILTRFVSRSGSVERAVPLGIKSTSLSPGGPWLAWNGNQALAVWVDRTANLPVRAVLLDARGSRVGDPFPIGENANWPHSVAIAGNQNGFLVVWQRRGETFGTSSLNVTSISPTASTHGRTLMEHATMHSVQPRVDSDGERYLLSFSNGEHSNGEYWTIILSAEGSPLTTPVRYHAGPASAGSIVWNGVSYISILSTQTGALLYRFDQAGQLLGVVEQPQRNAVAAAASDSRVLLVWREAVGIASLSRLAGALATPEGHETPVATPHPEFGIASTAKLQSAPRAASAGFEQLVVWTEFSPSAGRSSVMGRRFTPDGLPIDEAFLVSEEGQYAFHPHVAFDGTEYVAMWSSLRDPTDYSSGSVTGKRISLFGPGTGSKLFVIADPAWGGPYHDQTALSCAAARCLAMWTGPDQRIAYRLVRREHLADTTSLASSAGNPAVGASQAGFLIAWEQHFSGNCGIPCSWSTIRARLLSADGTTVREELPISDTPVETDPVVASDGSDFVVAWAARTSGLVAFRPVAGSTGELGPTEATFTGSSPSIAWTGHEYALSFLYNLRPAWNSNVYLSFFRTGGRLTFRPDQTAVTISPSEGWKHSPFILGSPQRLTSYYIRLAGEQGLGGVERAFFQTLDRSALPVVPDPPTNLRAHPLTNYTIVLEWQAHVGDISSYRIERFYWPNEWREVSVVPHGTTHTQIGDLFPGIAYSFRVRAENPAGLSLPTGPVTVVTEYRLPPTPIQLIATAEPSGTVTLRWQYPPIEVNFHVEQKTLEQPYRLVATALTNSAVISSPPRGVPLTFRVRAINELGSSDYSNEVTVVVPPRQRPARR